MPKPITPLVGCDTFVTNDQNKIPELFDGHRPRVKVGFVDMKNQMKSAFFE